MPEKTAIEKLETNVLVWPERARALRVSNAETYEQAAQYLLGIKKLRREIDEVFDPIIKQTHQAHKQAVESKKNLVQPLADAECIIKRSLADYRTEQERAWREEAERRAAEARRMEEDILLQQALAAEADGEHGVAEEILATPIIIATAAKPEVVPKVGGITYREVWSARVIDLLELVRFVAANPSFLNLITPNMTALNALARAQQNAMRIPGVAAVSDRVVSAGR